jgi:hypothetical protein
VNAIQKPLSGLKKFLKVSQSISAVAVADLLSFTQNLIQTRCLILPSIADKMKHEVEKALM